jgi:hypothetical protein
MKKFQRQTFTNLFYLTSGLFVPLLYLYYGDGGLVQLEGAS